LTNSLGSRHTAWKCQYPPHNNLQPSTLRGQPYSSYSHSSPGRKCCAWRGPATMGNTQSSIIEPDAPRKSRRRSHRLSKPMTGNHATAGLLSPGGFSNSTRRLSNVRMSFRPPPPSPASTPTTTTTTDTTPITASFESQSGLAQYSLDRSASAVSIEQKESRRRSLFRSRSSQGTSDSSRRQRSTGPVSRVADRLGRTNSMTYESAISYYGQTDPERLASLECYAYPRTLLTRP